MRPIPVRSFSPIAAILALALCGDAVAQVVPASGGTPDAARASAAGFLTRHGDGWTLSQDPATGLPRFIYGASFEVVPDAPSSAAGWEAAARTAIDTNVDFFGFESDALALDAVVDLPLSRVGSSDKVAVRFHQMAGSAPGALPVLAAGVTVLFDATSGRVLALDTTGVPGAADVPAFPETSMEAAVASARIAYANQLGVEATQVGAVDAAVMGPSVTWGLKNPINERNPALVWVVELSTPGVASDDGVPAQARVYVSAERDGTVFLVEETAHAAITGLVQGSANAGPEPNTVNNQETLPMRNLYVRQNAANGTLLATTDDVGAFTIAQDGPFSLFFELRGPFCDVVNGGGTDASILLSNVAGPTNVAPFFNPTLAEFPTAEVAAFHWVHKFRDFILATDSNDTTMDFQVSASVNNSSVAGISSCNAVWVGNQIQFLRAAGGCTNTAYRSVLLHEEGHWANARYNGDNGMTSAFHEGNADAWAYYISDDPCLTSFSGGGCLRSALQTSVKKCSTDGSESCNGGEGHTEGQAIASALWKVRTNLGAALGGAAGDALANQLFLGWMQSFDDKKILNVIQDHWIALDDDNGSLVDLTPHFSDISGGFKTYNWPDIDVPDLDLALVSAPVDNAGVSPGQAVQITADATSALGVLTAVQLFYSTNGGLVYTPVVMAPTGVPNRFSATIPGQANQTSVRWYVKVSGSVAGHVVQEPKAGGVGPHIYHAGLVTQLAAYDFEDLFSEQGWTHVALSGGSAADQWVRANPGLPGSNEPTDPKDAYSGFRSWGTDLSVTGTDGKYEPNTSSELRSPTFNFSGSSKVILQFRRWLASESAQFDPATVRVNGTTVWQSAQAFDTLDNAWTLQEIDISPQAANNPSVQVSFRIVADGGLEYGGWNIDDVFVYRLDAAPAGFFQAYGTGCAGTGGSIPSLQGSGIPAAGGNITVSIANGKPNASGLLLLGTAQANASLGNGCTLLVGGTLLGGGLSLPLNGAGGLVLPAQIPLGTPSVDVDMQFFPFDTGSANGQYSASNGLRMHVQ